MIFVLFYTFLFQTTIQLDDIPLKEKAISIKELAKIDGGDEGFYRNIDASLIDKNTVLVFDHGNYMFKIFDLSGKEIKRFGKKGAGPQEFNYLPPFKVVNNKIIVIKENYIEVYDHTGKFKFDFPIETDSKRNIFDVKNGFRLYTGLSIHDKQMFYDYDKNGKPLTNELTNFINPRFEEEKDANGLEEMMSFSIATRFKSYNQVFQIDENSFILVKNGIYEFEMYTIPFTKTITFKNKIKRQPLKESQLRNKVYVNGKRDEAVENRVKNLMISFNGGMQNDINGIKGNINKYLFVNHVTKDGDITDILTDEFKLYSHFEFNHPELKTWNIDQGKLIAIFKNEDIGPYVKIYDVIIN